MAHLRQAAQGVGEVQAVVAVRLAGHGRLDLQLGVRQAAGAGRSVALFTQDTANGVGCSLDSGDGVPLAERNATSARRASIGDHIQGRERLHEVEVRVGCRNIRKTGRRRANRRTEGRKRIPRQNILPCRHGEDRHLRVGGGAGWAV